MENPHLQEIVGKIKQEPEIEVLDQFTCEDSIVGNIKHEPERHFVFIMPDDPEPEELIEVKIILRKFDKKYKNPAKFFESYFVCNNCDFATRLLHNLKSHYKVCEALQQCKGCGLKKKSEKIKECGFCDLKFDCDNCKKNHQDQDHYKDSNWHCSKCDFKTLNKISLKQHYLIHVKKFTCETCQQIFAQKLQLQNHQQNHRHGVFATKPESKFECSTCDRSFATKSGLLRHERDVHSQMKLHCDICGKIIKTKNHLHQHMQTHLKISCPICQHMIACRRLREHIELHSASEKFECDDCEKVCPTKNSLYYHKRQKHEINEVQCDLCTKIFKNKLLLRVHIRNHLKVQCSICRKSMCKDALKKHMKMHSSGQKFLACKIKGCQQKFENIKELSDHEEIHIRPRSYKCPNCDYHTTTLQDMKKHMRSKSHETKINF